MIFLGAPRTDPTVILGCIFFSFSQHQVPFICILPLPKLKLIISPGFQLWSSMCRLSWKPLRLSVCSHVTLGSDQSRWSIHVCTFFFSACKKRVLCKICVWLIYIYRERVQMDRGGPV